MNFKDDILPVLVVIVIFLFLAAIVMNFASSSENNFNKTFEAVKSNTDLILSKTNMTGTEKTHYIINTCQIAFGNGAYRPSDVDLCKTKMGLR